MKHGGSADAWRLHHHARVRARTHGFAAGTRPAQPLGGGVRVPGPKAWVGGDPGIHAVGVGGPGWPPSEV